MPSIFILVPAVIVTVSVSAFESVNIIVPVPAPKSLPLVPPPVRS